LGASFILAINIALGLAIMVAFAAFGLYDRSLRPALYWLAACFMAIISGAIEYVLPSLDNTAIWRFFNFTTFAASMCLLSMGIAVRYYGRAPKTVFASLFVAAVLCYLTVSGMERTTLRNVFYQAPYAMIALSGVWFILAGKRKGALDRAVIAGLLFYAATFVARPLLSHLMGGTGATAGHYLSTNYAMASQTLMSISSILVGSLLIMRLLFDLIEKLVFQSETDGLSGMLNRSGFVRAIDRALHKKERGAAPMTLVVCDIDHFKAVNDTFGHQTGDRVIAGFGEMILARKRGTDLCGRIGGEEFCILLRNCDQGAARLFCEELRLATAARIWAEQGNGVQLTASFGFTEIEAGDTFERAFVRADAALYSAKADGRNRVVAAMPVSMPLHQASMTYSN
jgi:diguanylate cyclase (GGDEF)-like protein